MFADFFANAFCKYFFLNYVLAFVLGWIIYRWTSQRWLNLPPGPLGLPVLGCIPYLEGHAEKTFAKWSKQYGPIIMVDIGSTTNVVLNSYEAIEEAFVRQSSSFVGRYSTYFTRLASKNKGIVLIDNITAWKVQRPFGLKALFGRGIHGISIEDRILHEAEALCDVIRHKNGQPFVLENDLIYHIANVVSDLLVHERCSDHDDLKKYVRHIVDGFRENTLAYTLLTVFPLSRYFPFMQKSLKSLNDGILFGNGLMDRLIGQHMLRLDPKEARDMIDLFLIENKQRNYTFEDLEQLRYYLKDLFVAGTETTTSTIRWILFHIIKHPEIQRKIHEEIEQVLGSGGKVRVNLDLPYTRAVIQEGYRITPATPLSVPRSTTKDVTLMGYHIPKNTQIFANLFAVHNNSRHFPEPKKFIPERHLDDNGKFVKSNRIIPFSIGSRNCLGENLARSEVFLFIVTMLQKFEVLPNPENPSPPMEGVAGIVNSAPHYPIVMKEK